MIKRGMVRQLFAALKKRSVGVLIFLCVALFFIVDYNDRHQPAEAFPSSAEMKFGAGKVFRGIITEIPAGYDRSGDYHVIYVKPAESEASGKHGEKISIVVPRWFLHQSLYPTHGRLHYEDGKITDKTAVYSPAQAGGYISLITIGSEIVYYALSSGNGNEIYVIGSWRE